MEAVLIPATEEVAVSQLGDSTPLRFEEEELDLLAFELWQRASCPETPADQSPSSTAEEAWCRASCL